MPQLDFVVYKNELFCICFLFIFIYYILSNFYIPYNTLIIYIYLKIKKIHYFNTYISSIFLKKINNINLFLFFFSEFYFINWSIVFNILLESMCNFLLYINNLIIGDIKFINYKFNIFNYILFGDVVLKEYCYNLEHV